MITRRPLYLFVIASFITALTAPHHIANASSKNSAAATTANTARISAASAAEAGVGIEAIVSAAVADDAAGPADQSALSMDYEAEIQAIRARFKAELERIDALINLRDRQLSQIETQIKTLIRENISESDFNEINTIWRDLYRMSVGLFDQYRFSSKIVDEVEASSGWQVVPEDQKKVEVFRHDLQAQLAAFRARVLLAKERQQKLNHTLFALASQKRAAVLQKLQQKSSFSLLGEITQYWPDIRREVEAIPIKFLGIIELKAYKLREKFSQGARGWYLALKEISLTVLFFVFGVLFFKVFKSLSVAVDRRREKLLRMGYRDARARHLAVFLQRFSPVFPWLGIYLFLTITNAIVAGSYFAEINFLFSIAFYYIYYRVFRILVSRFFSGYSWRYSALRLYSKRNEIEQSARAIGLRAVRLNTLDDNLVTIPNSKFLTDFVASGNAGALDMMVVVNFHLAIDADMREARELIREVVATSRFAYLKKPVSIVFSEKMNEEKLWIDMQVKTYVFDVRYEKAFQTDVILRGNEVLKKAGIPRPLAAG